MQMMIRAEMKSILRVCTCTVKGASREDMASHSSDRHYTSLKSVAPVLIGILEACIHKNSFKRDDIIASCIAILAKSHGKHTVVHLLHSLILYSGHAGKMVYSRLQKAGVCSSSVSTRALVDILGTNHDAVVKEWVAALNAFTPTSQGYISGAPILDTSMSIDQSDSQSGTSTAFDFGSPMCTSTPPASEFSSPSSIEKPAEDVSPLSPDISLLTTSCSNENISESLDGNPIVPSVGGDQLTVSRFHGSQGILHNCDNGGERGEGLIPVIEDWHTKMCYMKVIWGRLYKSSSAMEGGTLFQLRNIINRRNVVSDVTKNLTALSKRNTGTTDHVLEYAKETMSPGLLLLEFKDAIREGDGTRILQCWKYFFIIFRATRHKNYCIEAFNLFMQYYYTLPPRYAEQMLWGRFINSEGGQGRNISADLHMEHLNHIVKDAVGHLGANKTPQAIMRASKALGALKEILLIKVIRSGPLATTLEDQTLKT
eukprot:Em0056g17a